MKWNEQSHPQRHRLCFRCPLTAVSVGCGVGFLCVLAENFQKRLSMEYPVCDCYCKFSCIGFSLFAKCTPFCHSLLLRGGQEPRSADQKHEG